MVENDSDLYDWRALRPPNSNPTLFWETTFGQCKSLIAKKWCGSSEDARKMHIERLVYYSSIVEIKEL
jgi:hypothetical protein